MARLQAIDPQQAHGQAGKLLADVQQNLGMAPNLLRTLANSPAALQAYLSFGEALESGVLPAKLREQISLTVSEANGCGYCVAAHCAIGSATGLSEMEITDARKGASPNSKVEAALRFARDIVEKQGWVSDDDLTDVRAAGYGDAEISEIVATVAWKIFANYFNHVAQTEVDFPEVSDLAVA